jgi:hypothetical protein
MKATTRKYVRILDAQSSIYTKIKKLPCYGDNWRKNRDKVENLEVKYNEYQNKLNELEPTITQEEYELYLSDRMCLTWEDFKN